MIEKEERILHQNAHEVNRHADTFQEMKIYNAMRGGIMRGKKREKRRIYSYGVGVAIAAAAAVLITFSFIGLPAKEVAEHSVQTASTKNWDNFKEYRLSYRLDPSLASALEQNLVKPVRQSAENKGYRVDVAGAVTDGRKVFVLYSVHNNTDKEVIHADFSLQFGAFKDPYPHKGTSLDMLGSESRIPAGQSVDFIYSTNLSPSVQYSKKVNLNVALTETSEEALASSGSSNSKYRTDLDVAFELDPDMFKDQQHTLSANRTLTVDGQKINVRQVLYTPMGTYVDLEYDKNNEKRIFQLINPVLIGKKGDTTEKLYYPGIITSDNSEVYTDDSKATLVFKNSQYSQPDSVTLKTFGISAVDKDQMKIVVDLVKKQIIEAPGSGLELVEPTPESNPEAGEILLRQKIDNAQYLNTYTWLADSFTDAQGKVHKRAPSGSFGVSRSKDGTAVNEIRYNFGEDAKNYPQPLTIPIEKFINPIWDTQAVELYSKN
ncbi:protein of unknown function [Paenibacillus sophorae]|uniref:DUF4179 domain-containing protein n=1 Tax=Paenibacillus sophorae TaxID=1333845 RepID=A0A1H8UT29_9BACL|nr:DUF4179 domain-containing protein [Paenibacillus sophorae]QWU15387.1 DUF4179 domain-containing protein [Paenibacillus sophorae]SEP06137.1 protein of unknown function [Paenibacillus sophorae]